jgi:hypothetical protein
MSPPNALVHRIPIFDPELHADPATRPLASLHGFRPIPNRWEVDWRFFLEGVDGPDPQPENVPQPSYKVDADLSSPLLALPENVAGDDPAPPHFSADVMRVLAVRNLLRGHALALPTGQDVARAMGVTPLTDAELFAPPAFAALSAADRRALAGRAPLWFYILREADVQTGASHLGAVGGRIVAEVLIGLLSGDPLSFLEVDPTWTPNLPAAHDGRFTLSDLINVAQA